MKPPSEREQAICDAVLANQPRARVAFRFDLTERQVMFAVHKVRRWRARSHANSFPPASQEAEYRRYLRDSKPLPSESTKNAETAPPWTYVSAADQPCPPDPEQIERLKRAGVRFL